MTRVDATTDAPLPPAAEMITSQWLTRAIARWSPGVEVVDSKIEEVIHGTSTKVRVRAEYNKTGRAAGLPELLIVKGGFEAHSNVLGNEQMYLLEMRFYRDVARWLEINAPRCFYADRDLESGQAIIILEDLTLRTVSFYDAFGTQTYAQVARRLDAMARYHAQTWDTGDFAAGNRLAWVPIRYDSERGVQQARHYLSEDVWLTFMNLPRGAAVPRPLRDLEQMRRALRKMAAAHREGSTCLIHGDSHLGNIYEDADGTPGFIDPQVARAPWSMEVAYHIVGALEVADRRLWERPLLACYLERLRGYGVDAPTFEEGWGAYCRDICHGLYVWLKNEDVFQTEAINTANTTRFGTAAIDCGTMEILR